MIDAFDTPLTRDAGPEGDTLTGPWRAPRQMLADQEYDGHTSVHDDATADKLGLPGAPIEGPTHFSQFDPLAVALFGQAWFERGCISAHFETMVVEGEQVQATVTCTGTRTGPASARARATKSTGEPVLSATLTLGDEPTELDERLARMQAKDPGELFIVDRVQVGTTSPAMPTSMGFDEWNGNLYPFSLADKLRAITEPSPWYVPGQPSPWGRAVVPTEMLSVLAHKVGNHLPVRGPSVGLFIDLEVKRHAPVFVDEAYTLTHQVVALGQSRRVESYWTRTTIVDTTGATVCTVLLHQGVFKASYADYPAQRL
jgi:acyl dehydratase